MMAASRSLRVACVVGAWVVAGCDASHARGPIDEACGGLRPASIEGCTPGLFHVDCGGTGEGSVLACRRGSCRWFANGCVPADHRASECPVDASCCEPSTGGMWPFPDDWTDGADASALGAMVGDLRTIAASELSPDAPSTIDVRVDPSTPGGAPSIECTGDTELRACVDSRYGVQRRRIGESLVISFEHGGAAPEVVYIEVLRRSAGFVARAFVQRRQDAGFTSPPSCASALGTPPPQPLITGELTLSAFDLDDRSLRAVGLLRAGDGEVRFAF